MPALPGAHQSLVTRGEDAIFHARACSRPPEPNRSIFMRTPMKVRATSMSVAQNSLGPQEGLLAVCPGCRDDLLQRRDMPDEGAAARCVRADRRLRSLADKRLFDPDIAGPCQRFDMGAEITVGRTGQPFQSGEVQPLAYRHRIQRRHDLESQRLMNDAVEFRHGINPACKRLTSASSARCPPLDNSVLQSD